MTDENKDFVIKDRRIFSDEGQEPEDTKTSDPQPKEEAHAETAQTEATPESQTSDAPLPELNFSTFVISLNASALVHLGAIADPVSGQTTKNLAMGKQTIDILGMLEEKTKGNLTSDEEKLLQSVLYDLRIIYVRESS